MTATVTDPASTAVPPPNYEPTVMIWLDLSKHPPGEPVRIRTRIKKNKTVLQDQPTQRGHT